MPLAKLSDAIALTLKEVSERVEKGGVDTIGISSGFPALDAAISGFRKDAVYFLGGRPGMGKSALAMTIAMYVASQKKKVLFLSLEMGADLLSLRILSSLTGIPADRIERGKLSKEEFELVTTAVKDTQKLTFGLLDDNVVSEEFVTYVLDFQNKYGLDFLVVDYISLFRDPNKFGDNERIGRISNNMRQIARVCQIPVLALGQLNREVEKRENHMPVLSDIRDSGSVEQDAFCVMFCYRPYYYDMMFDGAEPLMVEKDAKILIAKNRQGSVGQINACFYPERMQWTPHEIVITKPQPTGLGPLASKVRERRTE